MLGSIDLSLGKFVQIPPLNLAPLPFRPMGSQRIPAFPPLGVRTMHSLLFFAGPEIDIARF